MKHEPEGCDDDALVAELEAVHKQLMRAGDSEADHIAFETLIFCLSTGREVPKWAADAVCKVHAAYLSFRIPSLALALGCPDHRHLKSKRKKVLCGVVAKQVWERRQAASACGTPISREEAVADVAEWLGEGFSDSTVRDLVKEWESLCKATGDEPYAQSAATPADAARLIPAAICMALSSKSKQK